MELLIKKVEDFRMHIRNRNIIASVLAALLISNSLIGLFGDMPNLGFRLFHAYLVLLLLFICYYIYKNRTNLPFPKEITKESMEDYQKKQIRRYLYSGKSIIWWAFLPLLTVIAGLILAKMIFQAISLMVIMVILYVSNKLWVKKYQKQYQELGGEKLEMWFQL